MITAANAIRGAKDKGCEEKGSSGTVVWMSFQSLSKIVYPGLARLARVHTNCAKTFTHHVI